MLILLKSYGGDDGVGCYIPRDTDQGAVTGAEEHRLRRSRNLTTDMPAQTSFSMLYDLYDRAAWRSARLDSVLKQHMTYTLPLFGLHHLA
jgi:hypothetical protein